MAMPTTEQKQGLLDAVSQIRDAQSLLLDASRSMSDIASLIQTNTEYKHLDSYISQILHLQAIADDTDFNNAAAALKTQSSVLSVEAATISKIIKDVDRAAKIVGYISKAIQILGKL